MRKSEPWVFFLLPYFLVLGLFSLVSYFNRQAIQAGVETLAKEQLQATATILKANIRELLEHQDSPTRILDRFAGLEDIYFIALLDENERILDWHSKFEGYLPFSRRNRPAAEFWVVDSPIGSVFNHYSSLETADGRRFNLYLGYSLQGLDRLLARSWKNFWLMLGIMAVAGLIIFSGIYRLHASFEQASAEAVRQAKEKEKFKEISGFTAGVAHEVKNPLNSLILLFELLEKKSPPELSRQVLLGKEEIKKISAVIDRFSEIIKPLNLKKERVVFNDILLEEISSLKPLAQARKVELELQIQKKLAVDGDRLLLGRAVNNLIKNALEASAPDQRVLVQSGLHRKNLIFSVTDFGPGIEASQVSRIFEPFVSSKESGLGVGLYLVKKIVEAHQGKIYFKSGREGGTVFIVELPGGQDA